MAEDYNKKNEEFGRLLTGAINSIATYEGKTAPAVEQELGQQIGLSGASIQRYKRGHVPPEPRTIQRLAEAAVKRSFLDRRWLSRFLRVSAYPSPEPLLNALCPPNSADAVESPARRPAQNLPPPSYNHFVMRPGPYNEIIDALKQRNAVVVVASLGGMGKTSLVREVAARCLQAGPPAPVDVNLDATTAANTITDLIADAVVWISDAERPGFTTLNTVLDEIARTLGFESLIERGLDDKRRQVERLLRGQRVLVVVDNFETVVDMDLLRWLLKLPEPSKAIITTREYRREFRHGAWQIELRGMRDDEATTFVAQRLKWLRMENWITDPAQVSPLIQTTGGNPKAIEMALGSLKYGRRALQDVVDDLYMARGSLFESLFARNWSMLDEAARRVLLAATFFAPSANEAALAITADVRTSVFDRAVETLNDLSLLDVLRTDLIQKPRYALHPMVRAFAEAELRKDPAFEAAARLRWLDWYVALAAQVGYCRDDLKRLQTLDPERDMLHVVAAWAKDAGQTEKLLALAQGSAYYCYVRGLLGRQPNMNLAAADAALALHRPAEALKWLSHHAQRQARLGQLDIVEAHLPRMASLAQQAVLPLDVTETYRHAVASYYFARNDFEAAEQAWRSLLATPGLGEPSQLVTVKWLAECLRQRHRLEEAQALLEETLAGHHEADNIRAIVALKLSLAKVVLAQNELQVANYLTAQCREAIIANDIERHKPDVLFLEGRLAESRGEIASAQQAYEDAAVRFRQLGLRREIIEVEDALRELDAVG